MAHRAVHEYPVDALVAAFRGAHRQILQAAVGVLLVEHAEGLVAAARQVVAAHLGQRPPDPVRKAHLVLAAGGAILEVLHRIGVIHRHVAAEAPDEPQGQARREQHGEGEEVQEALLPAGFRNLGVGEHGRLLGSASGQAGAQGLVAAGEQGFRVGGAARLGVQHGRHGGLQSGPLGARGPAGGVAAEGRQQGVGVYVRQWS